MAVVRQNLGGKELMVVKVHGKEMRLQDNCSLEEVYVFEKMRCLRVFFNNPDSHAVSDFGQRSSMTD